MGNLPVNCPSCDNLLEVKNLSCPACGTGIDGKYPLPFWLKLKDEEQQFIIDFVKSSGSLKKMAASMDKSYPYVRNLLDNLIERIQKLEKLNEKTS